jgi:hypothetical protein
VKPAVLDPRLRGRAADLIRSGQLRLLHIDSVVAPL